MRSRGMPLYLSITLALVAKILILTLLYQAFFSAPQAKKMRMPAAQVEQHLLGTLPPLPAPKAQP